jgi:nitronate monooxygenase
MTSKRARTGSEGGMTMAVDRREFVKRTVVLTAGLGARELRAAPQPANATMPTPQAAGLMAKFGLKYPIFNAGMGSNAAPDLAIAVSNAGGLGAIGTGTAVSAETVRERVGQVRAGTKGLFAINYLLAFEPATLSVALDAGAPVVQFAWGLPGAAMVAAIRKANAKMGIQISNVEGARRAIDLGADYLICQGIEAGGHVQALSALHDALPAVIAEAKAVPVLAAGGIANGAHIRRALLAGASGALLGTRFIATKEAVAHDDYKTALTRANATDTALTICFQDGWPNAPGRTLRNRTIEMWEAAGCPPPGKRPGEGDVLTTNVVTGTSKRRYSVGAPVPNDRGMIAELPNWAGMGVGAIRDIPSAADLVARLWRECLASA